MLLCSLCCSLKVPIMRSEDAEPHALKKQREASRHKPLHLLTLLMHTVMMPEGDQPANIDSGDWTSSSIKFCGSRRLP